MMSVALGMGGENFRATTKSNNWINSIPFWAKSIDGNRFYFLFEQTYFDLKISGIENGSIEMSWQIQENVLT